MSTDMLLHQVGRGEAEERGANASLPSFLDTHLDLKSICRIFGFSKSWFYENVKPHVNFIKAGVTRYNVQEVRAVLETSRSLTTASFIVPLKTKGCPSFRSALKAILKEDIDVDKK